MTAEEKQVRDAEVNKLRRENDILRGLTARLMPCRYCGVDDMGKCPSGFPGCGLADDLFAGEDGVLAEARERVQKADAVVSAARQGAVSETQRGESGEMTAEEKAARDAEVLHWQTKTDEVINFWTARCNDVVAENTVLRERAEKTEAVVNAARAYYQRYRSNAERDVNSLFDLLCDAIDAYDAQNTAE